MCISLTKWGLHCYSDGTKPYTIRQGIIVTELANEMRKDFFICLHFSGAPWHLWPPETFYSCSLFLSLPTNWVNLKAKSLHTTAGSLEPDSRQSRIGKLSRIYFHFPVKKNKIVTPIFAMFLDDLLAQWTWHLRRWAASEKILSDGFLFWLYYTVIWFNNEMIMMTNSNNKESLWSVHLL